MWQRGLLNLICFEREIHRDCLLLWSSDVFFFWIHRNLIFLLNPDVSGMCGFWTIHRKCPHLGPFRCIVTQVSVGDTSGLRFQCPSRCTEVQIYLYNTSGWANIGHFRCIAKDRHTKIHRDSSIHSNPDVSKSSIHRKSKFSSNSDVFKLISREYTCSSSKCIPAQADFNTKIHRNSTNYSNPDVFQLISHDYTYIPSQDTPAQAGFTSISRDYTRFPSNILYSIIQ